MKLWSSLYLMIWLAFLQIWLAYTPILAPVPYYVHILLGFAMILAAFSNFTELRATHAPGRIKRIASITFRLTVLMALLGLFLYSGLGANGPALFGITLAGGVRFIHFINAMAILAQAAATAIAYDMWEDREFLQETQPGEIPPAPTPGGPPPPAGAPAPP